MQRYTPALIVFDLDGTLADTIKDIADSVNRIIAMYGFEPHNVDAYKRMVGDGFLSLIEKAIPNDAARNSELVQEILARAVQEYAAHSLDATKPFDGAKETLKLLSDRGIQLAVLSNKPQDLSASIVGALFRDIPFIAVWGNLPDRPRKPNPAAVLQICELANIAPQNCAFVGDSSIDMKTAKASGMTAVGALYGYRSREELLDAGADFLIASPQDLIALFGAE
ncbi:HAD-superfamily hydrolase, subfamily IA, variant 3 [uncultured spirochete]|jgi:phosphoglycolate phosphatase|uniref:phosphoglycolate phosphatase n=1 Tax=uncultured spirochete TaxID=156406 RepID=A0A3P3XFK8_9SPIR|nr:HAD family hydrolase [Rectinema subterraneum]SLM10173.1 HAD-superfamily hydrolase, subfamily IA, variant 3 [uncultured spirochete]